MQKKSMMKKLIAMALVGTMAVSLAACGAQADAPADAPADDAPAASAPAEKVEINTDTLSADAEGIDTADFLNRDYEGTTIQIQQWWGVELPDGYFQAICDDFEAETGITVEPLSAPWADTKTQIMSGLATGTAADLLAVDSAWLTDFVNQGSIVDIASCGVDTSAIAGGGWVLNGSCYAAPLLNFGYPLYVNMDILADAGVEAIPTTWTELQEACKLITAAGYEAFPINLGTKSPNGICNVVMGMASASGITMKDASGNYDFASNDDLKAFLEFIKALWDDGSVASGAESLEEAQMTSNFTAGNYAFTIASMSMLSDYTDAGLNVECAKIPVKDGYTGQSGMCVASWAVGINEASENKEAAAMFINYLFKGKDGDICADMAVQKAAFPSSLVAKPDFSAMPAQFNAVYEIYTQGYPENQFIGIPATEQVETDMTNALVKYLHGDADIDATMEAFQAAIDAVQ